MRRLAVLALVVPLLAACGASGSNAPDGPIAPVPSWVEKESLPPNAVPGAVLFITAGCTACHTYLGYGKSVLGGPDLTAIGQRGLGAQRQIEHLKCPSCTHPGSQMPPFGQLGSKRLRQLAIFLEASKGSR